jgi:hypothetical protein
MRFVDVVVKGVRGIKGYGTSFDELCLIMTGFDRGQPAGLAGFLPMRFDLCYID